MAREMKKGSSAISEEGTEGRSGRLQRVTIMLTLYTQRC